MDRATPAAAADNAVTLPSDVGYQEGSEMAAETPAAAANNAVVLPRCADSQEATETVTASADDALTQSATDSQEAAVTVAASAPAASADDADALPTDSQDTAETVLESAVGDAQVVLQPVLSHVTEAEQAKDAGQAERDEKEKEHLPQQQEQEPQLDQQLKQEEQQQPHQEEHHRFLNPLPGGATPEKPGLSRGQRSKLWTAGSKDSSGVLLDNSDSSCNSSTATSISTSKSFGGNAVGLRSSAALRFAQVCFDCVLIVCLL